MLQYIRRLCILSQISTEQLKVNLSVKTEDLLKVLTSLFFSFVVTGLKNSLMYPTSINTPYERNVKKARERGISSTRLSSCAYPSSFFLLSNPALTKQQNVNTMKYCVSEGLQKI